MLAVIERQAPRFEARAVSMDPGQLYQTITAFLPGAPASAIPRPQRYEDFARAYGQVVWVYAALSRKAMDVASVPIRVSRRTGADEQLEEVERDHPVRQVLRRVNNFMTLADLLESTSVNLDLTGNAYWLLFGPRRGGPTEIWPLRPDRVDILPGRDQFIDGYRYRIGSEQFVFSADQVIQFKEVNPWHDYYGQGALGPAWESAVITSDAHTWNRNLLRNAGRLDGVLTSDQVLQDKDATEISNRFRAMFAGPQNAGRVLVTGKGIKYETIATTPKEIDFVESLKFTREEILAACRVPPVILFLESGDIGRRVEQIRDYFHSTVRGRCSKIAGTLNEFLLPQYADGDELEVGFDIDAATAQFEDRLLLAQIDEILVRTRTRTPNELRKRDGLSPIEGGDTPMISVSMVPVTTAITMPRQPMGGGTPAVGSQADPNAGQTINQALERLLLAYLSERMLSDAADALPARRTA